ncbi:MULTISPECIES: amino-acid N-acetyltransferase [Treponema]|uniref:amino-acid N-acetyltransferase n=2 Tax=Treponema saccharophilum TaxID=165 RepID=H7EPQ1_9SPIR|nr:MULTISPECIES: amino-acid N-acetyltransferase [Treponema]EIC00452.1 amino-acid N-acetyltransferase [Treponema saccharophilum DSM 2985]MBQ5536373.1 amino-acid N-acetyltransferase [Treponema sp.]BDC94988.1 amino-acid acetyltransferase [Treponema saccharophilum]
MEQTEISKNPIQEKAERIRDVIRYIKKFKNAAVVIHIDDRIIDSQLFSNHIRDISLIHEAGLRVIIVPGARRMIDHALRQNGIGWTVKNGSRITPPEAMPLIKTAAFDAANSVMTSLAGEHLTAVIGNWVRARGKGVLSGVDYGSAGEIDKIDDGTLATVLDNGFIPIFPCIGWSLNGKPYNISSVQLAAQIAVLLKADKLFYLLPDAEISGKFFSVPEEIGLSPEGCVPAMDLDELDSFLSLNKKADKSKIGKDTSYFDGVISMVKLAKNAVKSGVTRVHILNGSIEGTLPCEIFSDLGSGTMIYASNYGKFRAMRREDIPAVLSLIRPFVIKKILLPRSEEMLESTYNDYIVYELDGAVRACAALHMYGREQAEIAGVAVDETCAHIGIGPKMISYLIEKAKTVSIQSVFILTTQTADWFERLGFVADTIESLPEARRKIWNPKRGSKVFRLKI